MQLSAIHYLPAAEDTTGACAALAGAGGADSAEALRAWSLAALVRHPLSGHCRLLRPPGDCSVVPAALPSLRRACT